MQTSFLPGTLTASELSSYSEVLDLYLERCRYGDKSSAEEFILDVLSGGDVDLLINVGASI